MCDVCAMAGVFCSHSSDCIGILNLSGFYLPSTSFGDDRAIQNAIYKIKNCPDFFASECIDLITPADLGENKAKVLAERYSAVFGMERRPI